MRSGARQGCYYPAPPRQDFRRGGRAGHRRGHDAQANRLDFA